jgi:hypothetical protein
MVRLANWVVQLGNKTVQEIGQRIHILCYKTVGSHCKQLFNRSNRAVYTRESSSEWP